MTKSQNVITLFLLACLLVASPEAFAKKKKSKGRGSGGCSTNIVRSSMYFVPHIKDYCSPATVPCKAFKNEVRMQGSGAMFGNQTYQYSPRSKSDYITRDIGECDTAVGAANECLIPFISVAADPKFYEMGDVISMPTMKGREIQLPNGKKMIHPGYFIVHDTGGAIKGKNRFDFFTGSFDDHNANNAFGYDGFADLAITDKKSCNPKKQFTVVRQGTNKYDDIMVAINEAKLGVAEQKMLASSIDNVRTNYVRGVQ